MIELLRDCLYGKCQQQNSKVWERQRAFCMFTVGKNNLSREVWSVPSKSYDLEVCILIFFIGWVLFYSNDIFMLSSFATMLVIAMNTGIIFIVCLSVHPSYSSEYCVSEMPRKIFFKFGLNPNFHSRMKWLDFNGSTLLCPWIIKRLCSKQTTVILAKCKFITWYLQPKLDLSAVFFGTDRHVIFRRAIRARQKWGKIWPIHCCVCKNEKRCGKINKSIK